MKKLIVTILLVSVLGCGCGGVNNKTKLATPNSSLKNKEGTLSHNEGRNEKIIQQTNQVINKEEVIENPTPQKTEEQKDNIENLHPIDKAESDCIAKVYSTYDISQCSYKAMDSWFKEIDKYLGLLKTITSEEDYANILKAQEDWKRYQESDFEAVSIIMNKQGTMFQNVAVGKKTDIIKERALELKGLYDTLKYE